jgi:ADP-ribosylation factor-like protein 2
MIDFKVLQLDAIKKHHWKIFETSAYKGTNLLEAMEWLCTDVSSRILVPE